jgi:hypothetical protein
MEGNGRGLIEVLSQHLPGETEEYHERVRGVPVEIRTEHSQNTSLHHYRLSNPPGFCFVPALPSVFHDKIDENFKFSLRCDYNQMCADIWLRPERSKQAPEAVFCLLWHRGKSRRPLKFPLTTAPSLNSSDFIHTPRTKHLLTLSATGRSCERNRIHASLDPSTLTPIRVRSSSLSTWTW